MNNIFREHILAGVNAIFRGENREDFKEADRSPVSLFYKAQLWQLKPLNELNKRIKWPDLHLRGKFLTAMCRG